MAFAHGGHVYEYITGGPFDDEAYVWELIDPVPVQHNVAGYIVHNVSPDDSSGFIPYDNDGEIWPVKADSKREATEAEVWPSEVMDHFFGPMHE
jgi:hypothetical protein